MTLRIAAVLLAGVVGLGCSSKGDPGPQGPTGPTGPKGDAGAAGQPGVSVLSAALTAGSLDCPTGGSQFTSASGTTFACNGTPGPPGIQGSQGDQGVKGDPGPVGPPAALVVDGTGATVGQFLGYVGGGNFLVAETWGSQRVIVERDLNGLIPFRAGWWPKFALSNCQGEAFVATGPSSKAWIDLSTSRYFVANGAKQTVQVQSYYYQSSIGPAECTNIGPTPSTETLMPMVYLVPPAAPVPPLDLMLP